MRYNAQRVYLRKIERVRYNAQSAYITVRQNECVIRHRARILQEDRMNALLTADK